MFGDDYILRIAQATREALAVGLYEHMRRKLSPKTPDPMAENLAYAVIQRVLGSKIESSLPAGFIGENEERIEREVHRLADDRRLREILSGAAYNMGYGYYIRTGGGRIVNRYIGFMRADSRAQRGTRSDWDLLRGMGEDLNRKEPRISGSVLRTPIQGPLDSQTRQSK